MTGESDEQRRSLAVVTPSYARDFELCVDLAASVQQYSGDDITHHIIVPASDLGLFSTLAGARTHIHSVHSYLPKSFVRLPRINMWINLRRPFPPIRGWIAQQIVKLAVVASLDSDVALVVDSDMVMIREFEAESFLQNARAILYRKPNAITEENLPRHVLWHRVARKLLGLDPSAEQPFSDYVSWPCVWEPELCRRLLTKLELVNNRHWQTVIASQLHFSEMILYGVYVDEILDSERSLVTRVDSMRCITHDAEVPLTLESFRDLLSRVSDRELAVMVSAKSGTTIDVRRIAWEEWKSSPTDDRAYREIL